MNYSITGFAYLTFFLAFGFLVYRFFQYWKREKDLVSKLWLYAVILVEIFTLIKAIGGLFFSTNPTFLEMTIDAAAAVEAFIFAILAYLIVYLKFPRVSPWLGLIPVLILGLIAFVLTVMTSFNPHLEESGAINWGFSSGPFVFAMAILRIFLALLVLTPIIIILFQQFKISKDLYAKRKAFGFSLSIIIASSSMLLDFLLVSFLKVDPIWRDIEYIAISIILFITLILTMPRPLPGSSSYYIKSSSKL
ncbi:hypothetical protein AMJ48_00920 [Parcubacteria bacterium DG_74_1]|nr:MAG: hypothetical protein AMJ48_00920 [Parcubacteria bacterium DG_74_1]